MAWSRGGLIVCAKHLNTSGQFSHSILRKQPRSEDPEEKKREAFKRESLSAFGAPVLPRYPVCPHQRRGYEDPQTRDSWRRFGQLSPEKAGGEYATGTHFQALFFSLVLFSHIVILSGVCMPRNPVSHKHIERVNCFVVLNRSMVLSQHTNIAHASLQLLLSSHPHRGVGCFLPHFLRN